MPPTSVYLKVDNYLKTHISGLTAKEPKWFFHAYTKHVKGKPAAHRYILAVDADTCTLTEAFRGISDKIKDTIDFNKRAVVCEVLLPDAPYHARQVVDLKEQRSVAQLLKERTT